MKQALRVAFGFLMLWAAVLHAEVRIEITQGGGLGATDWRCAF
ncbi:translocation protein TolB [Salmonella enterica subsp. enterica]|uniref:Translocation protein TolB n=1 Tax=Salmonella enterica I TaxID=59201 RepID=A0A447MVR9_SALET|nr:translocation protein TolB [Salmonella enterica subsp. enterica]VDZ95154.1 translocation protein TolB [Salmonella enterica subsp. enterica]